MGVTAPAASILSQLAGLAAWIGSRQLATAVTEQSTEIRANIGQRLDGLMKYSIGISAFVGFVSGLSPVIASAQERDTDRQNALRSQYEDFLSDATLLDRGEVTAYRKGDRFLVELRAERLGRLVLWHAEAIEMPTEVDEQNQIGTTVVSLERHGNLVLVRDRAPGLQKRAGRTGTESEGGASVPHPADLGVEPIYSAIAGTTSAPIMAAAPVIASDPHPYDAHRRALPLQQPDQVSDSSCRYGPLRHHATSRSACVASFFVGL